MPLMRATIDGKPCWKWGDNGKCYPYEPNNPESEYRAKQKAVKQGNAIKSQMDNYFNRGEK